MLVLCGLLAQVFKCVWLSLCSDPSSYHDQTCSLRFLSRRCTSCDKIVVFEKSSKRRNKRMKNLRTEQQKAGQRRMKTTENQAPTSKRRGISLFDTTIIAYWLIWTHDLRFSFSNPDSLFCIHQQCSKSYCSSTILPSLSPRASLCLFPLSLTLSSLLPSLASAHQTMERSAANSGSVRSNSSVTARNSCINTV